jgi:hypothetical protein
VREQKNQRKSQQNALNNLRQTGVLRSVMERVMECNDNMTRL